MYLISDADKNEIYGDIVAPFLKNDFDVAALAIDSIARKLYAAIPQKKRISIGRVHVVRVLSDEIIGQFEAGSTTQLIAIGRGLFGLQQGFNVTGIALALITRHGLFSFNDALPWFESAASSGLFDVREFAQMFFKKLILPHKASAHIFLEKAACSNDPRIRRFASETLRPVCENRWMYEEPEYSLSILRLLFGEKSPYPRTSVGNNLSDLARKLPDLVYALVAELLASGDKNSRWIAYRACRNLVKKEPLRVMNLFEIDEYRYKSRITRRRDHS